MKTKFLKIYLLCSLILCFAPGCKKSVQTEPLTRGDLAVYLLGELVPSSVAMDKNLIATVYFVGSNLIYKLDLNADMLHANSYWGRLVYAQKNSTAVKVYVTKQTEIIRIE